MDNVQPQQQDSTALINQLRKEIEMLKAKLVEREAQQIIFPLDRASVQIIRASLGL